MAPRSTRPLRKSSSAPPARNVKRGGAADSPGQDSGVPPRRDTVPAGKKPAGKTETGKKPAPQCPFCGFKHFRVLHGNDLAVALRDEYPVSEGHTLIITRRHVRSWFDATENERSALLELADRMRERLEASDSKPDGYNIGINVGEAAGQTIPHLHLHLIPRYRGDVEDPRGGVRHVIPGKGNYLVEPRKASAGEDE